MHQTFYCSTQHLPQSCANSSQSTGSLYHFTSHQLPVMISTNQNVDLHLLIPMGEISELKIGKVLVLFLGIGDGLSGEWHSEE